VVRAHRAKGRLPLYLTGRLRTMSALTRRWLDEQGFPPGPVVTTTDNHDAVPSAKGVQAFKLRTLTTLGREVGIDIVAAYGNAETDVCAYALAGIPPARTFIIGPNGGKACPGHAASQPLPDGYTGHLAAVP
jgi:phosphatidate phosphatase PAH1